MIRRRPRSSTLPTLAAVTASTLGLAACGGDDGGTTTVVQTPAETVTVQAQPATTAAEAPSTAQAPTTTSEPSSSAGSTTRSEAVAIARSRYPGERRIGTVGSDEDDGRREWEVRLRTAGGAERTVTVAQDTGRIVDVDVDRPDRDDDRDDD
jgi:uncharacterized membrane protein YkoI